MRSYAQSTWRSSGARTQSEAYGYWLQAYRRDMGMTVVREMARHRLNRVPFVGVERRFVQERVRAHVVHGDQGRLGDFYAHQAAMRGVWGA